MYGVYLLIFAGAPAVSGSLIQTHVVHFMSRWIHLWVGWTHRLWVLELGAVAAYHLLAAVGTCELVYGTNASDGISVARDIIVSAQLPPLHCGLSRQTRLACCPPFMANAEDLDWRPLLARKFLVSQNAVTHR